MFTVGSRFIARTPLVWPAGFLAQMTNADVTLGAFCTAAEEYHKYRKPLKHDGTTSKGETKKKETSTKLINNNSKYMHLYMYVKHSVCNSDGTTLLLLIKIQLFAKKYYEWASKQLRKNNIITNDITTNVGTVVLKFIDNINNVKE